MHGGIERESTVTAMSAVEDTEVNRLLEGAAELITGIATCWLVTLSGVGKSHARPMGRLPPLPSNNDWKVLFLADGRTRKVAEVRSASRVELIYQNDPEEAFATLTGLAKLIVDPVDVCKLWIPRYDVHFPTAEDRAYATFIEIEVDRMELWIRGVTPEPFGFRPTVINRGAEGRWRLGAP